MRMIDADALERDGWSLQRTYQKDKETMVYEVKAISEIPTAQPERKKGKWKPDRDNERDWYCSECDYIGNRWFPYCPNCGADMRGKEDE